MAFLCDASNEEGIRWLESGGVTIPNDPGYPFTLSAWIYPTTPSVTNSALSFGSPLSTQMVHLSLSSSGKGSLFAHQYEVSPTANSSSANDWNLNEWNHLYGVLWLDGDNKKNTRVVLNGNLSDGGTAIGSTGLMSGNTEVWQGGIFRSGPVGFLNGYIGGGAIWSGRDGGDEMAVALSAGYAPSFFPEGLMYNFDYSQEVPVNLANPDETYALKGNSGNWTWVQDINPPMIYPSMPRLPPPLDAVNLSNVGYINNGLINAGLLGRGLR